MSSIHLYAELLPDEMAERLSAFPVAIMPWGALEWHGPHLPFGLDGIVAEGFSRSLASRTGAVLLPTTYLPITALPHPQSLSINSEQVAGVWRDAFSNLHRAGFKLICLVSGHYAQGHEIALMDAAEVAIRAGAPVVLAGSPLALLEDPALLDHAGKWEASQLQFLRPDLVRLERLPEGALPSSRESGVLGDDPRHASAAQGERLFERALQKWSAWIETLLEEEGTPALLDLYSRRRGWYADYVRRYYRDSWEQAIEDWWREAGG